MTDRCLEIAKEIIKLMQEFKENMPDDESIHQGWEAASMVLQILWHKMYEYQTNEIWFNTPKEEFLNIN